MRKLKAMLAVVVALFDDVDLKDLLVRAGKTFWQAFAAVIVIPLDALDLGAWETTLVAAGAAGLSAVWTLIYGLFTK